MADLICVSEAAELLGVSTSAVSNWLVRFAQYGAPPPEPTYEWGKVKVYPRVKFKYWLWVIGKIDIGDTRIC